MAARNLSDKLYEFAELEGMLSKGALSVALVVTRKALVNGLPLDPEAMLTQGGGQVAGLSMSNVQKILNDHGIGRTLAREGGRTSRGNIGRMQAYVAFLNHLNEEDASVDLQRIEEWWVSRIREYFAGKPLEMHYDTGRSVRRAIADLFSIVEERQKDIRGATILGTVLQHLIGAKLRLLLDAPVQSYGASVADEGAGRAGDFEVEDVAIHVTTSPSESLIMKCSQNLSSGLKAVIVTLGSGVTVAEQLAKQAGIDDRIDVFDGQQFLAGNVYELGSFHLEGRRNTLQALLDAYNVIVDECETDPGLKIVLK